MTSNADLIIVGGGIVGCSAAWFAARDGMRVILIDKGDVAFEQSSRNWGWVHQQIRYPHIIPLAMMSRGIWEGLGDALGTDVGWAQGGNLSLGYSDADRIAFEGYRKRARAAGLDSAFLDRSEIESLVPGIAGPWTCGLHIPSDGQANPEAATSAIAEAARQQGVDIRTNLAAHSVDLSGGSVTGVATSEGSLSAPNVLVAAGAWSRRFLRPLGISLPQSAVRATVIRTAPVEPVSRITGWGRGVAFRQDAEGRFVLAGSGSAIVDITLDSLRDFRRFGRRAWARRRALKVQIGATFAGDLATLIPGTRARRRPWDHLSNLEPEPDPGAEERLPGHFAELFPHLEGVGVEKIWAGNIDMMPDDAPVLDAVSECPGLFIATGFSGHGFAMGPGGGRIAADLVTGKSPALDIRPFRLARFRENDLPELAAFHP